MQGHLLCGQWGQVSCRLDAEYSAWTWSVRLGVGLLQMHRIGVSEQCLKEAFLVVLFFLQSDTPTSILQQATTSGHEV